MRGNTPLQLAIQSNSPALVKFLMKKKSVNINQLLMFAIRSSEIFSLEEGMENNEADLISKRHNKIVKYLIEICDKAKLNDDEIKDILEYVKENPIELDINKVDFFNKKAGLVWSLIALVQNDKNILKHRKFNINEKYESDNTLVHYAAKCGLNEVIQILKSLGADLNILNVKGHTALHLAAENGHIEVVKAFIEAGIIKANPKNSLGSLTWALGKGYTEIIKVFLEALVEVKADFNFVFSSKRTILTNAVVHKDIYALKALVKAGANIDALDGNGNTALTLAVKNRDIDVLKALVKVGANIDALDGNGNTALTLAVKNRDIDVLKVLVKAGANIDALDRNGNTALTVAFYLTVASNIRHNEIIKELIKKGGLLGLKLYQINNISGLYDIMKQLVKEDLPNCHPSLYSSINFVNALVNHLNETTDIPFDKKQEYILKIAENYEPGINSLSGISNIMKQLVKEDLPNCDQSLYSNKYFVRALVDHLNKSSEIAIEKKQEYLSKITENYKPSFKIFDISWLKLFFAQNGIKEKHNHNNLDSITKAPTSKEKTPDITLPQKSDLVSNISQTKKTTPKSK